MLCRTDRGMSVRSTLQASNEEPDEERRHGSKHEHLWQADTEHGVTLQAVRSSG